MVLTIVCITSVFFNNFGNLFLTDLKLKTFKYRY